MLRPLILASLITLLAACGSPSTGTDTGIDVPSTPELATCPSTVVISNFEYTPDNCQVAPGTTLTFVNEDTVQHTATSSAGAPASFDTGPIDRKDSATVTFDTAGVYPYYCTIHPDMLASITVK